MGEFGINGMRLKAAGMSEEEVGALPEEMRNRSKFIVKLLELQIPLSEIRFRWPLLEKWKDRETLLCSLIASGARLDSIEALRKAQVEVLFQCSDYTGLIPFDVLRQLEVNQLRRVFDQMSSINDLLAWGFSYQKLLELPACHSFFERTNAVGRFVKMGISPKQLLEVEPNRLERLLIYDHQVMLYLELGISWNTLCTMETRDLDALIRDWLELTSLLKNSFLKEGDSSSRKEAKVSFATY